MVFDRVSCVSRALLAFVLVTLCLASLSTATSSNQQDVQQLSNLDMEQPLEAGYPAPLSPKELEAEAAKSHFRRLMNQYGRHPLGVLLRQVLLDTDVHQDRSNLNRGRRYKGGPSDTSFIRFGRSAPVKRPVQDTSFLRFGRMAMDTVES